RLTKSPMWDKWARHGMGWSYVNTSLIWHDGGCFMSPTYSAVSASAVCSHPHLSAKSLAKYCPIHVLMMAYYGLIYPLPPSHLRVGAVGRWGFTNTCPHRQEFVSSKNCQIQAKIPKPLYSADEFMAFDWVAAQLGKLL
ncbi:hypothetical protein J6590_098423, partial [Homalodisca vitripennis]